MRIQRIHQRVVLNSKHYSDFYSNGFCKLLVSPSNSNIKNISISLFLFFLAGLCEIGGGYLVWLWLREDKSWILGIIGGFILFVYGINPTFQPSHFHRTYAAYGGIFIVFTILWGVLIDKKKPGRYEILYCTSRSSNNIL